MFARLHDAELALFAGQSASALADTAVHEVQNGSVLLVSALLGLARDSLILLAYLLLNWKLTLIVAALFPAVAWVMKTLSRRLYRITKACSLT